MSTFEELMEYDKRRKLKERIMTSVNDEMSATMMGLTSLSLYPFGYVESNYAHEFITKPNLKLLLLEDV
jgi:hypothetical protein